MTECSTYNDLSQYALRSQIEMSKFNYYYYYYSYIDMLSIEDRLMRENYVCYVSEKSYENKKFSLLSSNVEVLISSVAYLSHVTSRLVKSKQL